MDAARFLIAFPLMVIFVIAALFFVYLPIYIVVLVRRRYKNGRILVIHRPALYDLIVIFVLVLILLSIFLPFLLRFTPKARMSEAKTNLTALARSQNEYFDEYGFYPGFKKENGVLQAVVHKNSNNNRFAYYCGKDRIYPRVDVRNFEPPVPGPEWPYPFTPYEAANGFTCIAVGNIDVDDFLDVWTISQNNKLTHQYDDLDNIIFYGRNKSYEWLSESSVAIAGLIASIPLFIALVVWESRRYRAALEVAQSKRDDQS